MIGKIKQLKWTEKPESSRDLVFIILILAFGLILVAKLSPHFQDHSQNIIYSAIQTVPNPPKSILDRLSNTGLKAPSPYAGKNPTGRRLFPGSSRDGRSSVIERPIFDGHSVVLKVKAINRFTSIEPGPVEAAVVAPFGKAPGDIDFSIAKGGKLVGVGNANISAKRLFIEFSELISRNGRSYSVQGRAVSPETLSAGISGEYNSGLPLRLLGVAIDKAIHLGDQIGMAYLLSSFDSDGAVSRELRNAAMETNQQVSQSISTEATKDLRETPAEVSLPEGSVFYVQIRGAQGARHP